MDANYIYEKILSNIDKFNNGEIWFFCEKTNDIKGDNLTKEIEKICFDNEIHFYKCTTHSNDFPIDVIMINKNKNNFN